MQLKKHNKKWNPLKKLAIKASFFIDYYYNFDLSE